MRAAAVFAIPAVVCLLAAPPPAAAQIQPAQAVTLEAAIAGAIERHPSVVAAARAVQAAEARLVQARAGRTLQIGVTGQAQVGTLGVTGAPTGGGTTTSHNVAVEATLPLYDGGLTVQQIAQAEAALEAARASLEAARQDAGLTAAQSFFQVLRAQRTVEVREAALQTAQAQVRQAEAFFRAGTAAQADVIRARAAAAAAEADLVAARGQVDTAYAAFWSATALPLGQPVALADPGAPTVVTVGAAEASAEAVRQRPEVRRAEAEVRSAEAALAMARLRAGLQVSVSATGSVQVTPDPGAAGWSVGATVSHPLFDGGRSRAAVEEAAASLAAAAARREAAVLQVRTQAYQAAVGVTSASARAEATRVSAEAAAEALRVSEGRYRAGVGTLVEVLDAQAQAASARVGAVQALYDLHLAVVSLRHALGRSVAAQR